MKPKNHKNCRCLVVHLAMPFVHHPRAAENHGEKQRKSCGKAVQRQSSSSAVGKVPRKAATVDGFC